MAREDSPTLGGTDVFLYSSSSSALGPDSIVPTDGEKAGCSALQQSESPGFNRRGTGKTVSMEHLTSAVARTAAAAPDSDAGPSFSDDTTAAAAWAAAAVVAVGQEAERVRDGGERSIEERRTTSLSTRDGHPSMTSGMASPPKRSNLQKTATPSPRRAPSPLSLPSGQKTSDSEQQSQQQQPQRSQQEQMMLVPAKSVDMDLDPNDIHIFRDGFLGQGAFGAVYRGVYRQNMVAVKLLNGSVIDGRTLQRDMVSFHAEMSILSRLRHK